MTNQQFQDFLESHPSIKLVTFSKECGLSESAIHKLKSGELKMSDRLSKAIEPVAVKYGFK